MVIELTEQEIIAGCKNKDRKVQEYLYRRYYADYRKICGRYADCEPDEKTLLNDAFFKIFTRIEQYNYEGALEAWMRRIVVNTCLDYVRQRKRMGKAEITKEQEHFADLNIATANSAIGALGYKELMLLVQSLPDTHRTVFNLNIFEGFSHSEISKVLHISEGTSQWYLSKAREMLRRKIAN